MVKRGGSEESAEKKCYKLLSNVLVLGGYSNIVLNDVLQNEPKEERAYITRLFYGVIEKSIQFDYIISLLTTKPPQKSVSVLIKIGLYLLRCTDTPDYAAVGKTVDLAKEVGKSGVSGFINALLRKSQSVVIPKDNLSVFLSYPEWVIKLLKKRYDDTFIVEMLQRQESAQSHIRRNSLKISEVKFDEKLVGAQKTPLGYLVDSLKTDKLKASEYTFQSLSSMLAVRAYLSGEKFARVLDVCSAPGGKAIYLKELSPNSDVVCSDIHPHRVELIKKYATRMGTNVSCVCEDAAKFNPAWEGGFDLVICDVPCSGLGVKSKPDILLNRSESDLESLSAIQLAILLNAAKYVRRGGILCYSTCTVFAEENEDVVEKFLSANKEFAFSAIKDCFIEGNGMLNLYPQIHCSDGFFIARLRREN